MINKVELTCFRKHESRVFTFTEGLQAIRAPNEGGKTTLLESIAYALYGTKALRDSLDDVVTWGRPGKDLRVVLHYGDFVISRSKGSAEVTSMGQVHVTGQAEVTRFCEGLLGAAANTASNLMLAGQTSLRGALSSGPKATATLIEDLGGFDLFDKLLDAANHRWALGSAAVQEDRLKSLRTQLEQLPIVRQPDEAAHQTEVERLGADLDEVRHRAERIEPELSATTAQHQAEVATRAEVGRVRVEIERLQSQIDETLRQQGEARVEGSVQDTAELERRISAASEADKIRSAYEKFLALPGVSRRDREAVMSDNLTRLAEVAALNEATIKAREGISVAQAKMVTSSTCGFCGQDVSQFPEIERSNAALEAQIVENQRHIREARDRLEILAKGKSKLDADLKAEESILRAVRGIEPYVEGDYSVIPVSFTWKGRPPADAEDAAALAQQLKRVRAQNDAILRGSAKVEALDGVIKRLVGTLTATRQRLADLVTMGDEAFSQLVAKTLQLQEEKRLAESQADDLETRQRDLKAVFAQATAQWQSAQATRQGLVARVTETETEIDQLAFNNALVKKIRAARPMIGNKLWTMVLSSVSAIFSQMRGENSVVTKGESGFEVNGRAMSSYSGSTQDLLGLAVRCALVKTFLPSCNFLILDEPSAACDQDRTNAMLGYIAASGFQQVLLVTHNEASESFAHNLITL